MFIVSTLLALMGNYAVLPYVIPQKIRYLWLLAASYYFYMCWNAKYALLLLFSTLATYISGYLIDRIRQAHYPQKKEQRWKSWVVAACCVIIVNDLL